MSTPEQHRMLAKFAESDMKAHSKQSIVVVRIAPACQAHQTVVRRYDQTGTLG